MCWRTLEHRNRRKPKSNMAATINIRQPERKKCQLPQSKAGRWVWSRFALDGWTRRLIDFPETPSKKEEKVFFSLCNEIMSESGSRVRPHFTAEVEFMWTEDWRKKKVIFYKQKWHWKQHIFPSTSQPSVYPRFLQFRADLKLCGCTSGKSKGVTARGVWCDHRNWVWNTAKAQIQSQWYLKNGLQGELMVKTRKEKIIRSCRGRITGFTRQNT